MPSSGAFCELGRNLIGGASLELPSSSIIPPFRGFFDLASAIQTCRNHDSSRCKLHGCALRCVLQGPGWNDVADGGHDREKGDGKEGPQPFITCTLLYYYCRIRKVALPPRG